MRILMLGWEFPPHISGGLGTACQGICEGLAASDVEVLFVVPRAFGGEQAPSTRVIGANQVEFHESAALLPDGSPDTIREARSVKGSSPGATPQAGSFMEGAGTGRPFAGAPGSLGEVRSFVVDSGLRPYMTAESYASYVRDGAADGQSEEDWARDWPAGCAAPGPRQLDQDGWDHWTHALAQEAASGIRPPGAARHEFAGGYGGDLFSEVARYARVVAHLARSLSFDLVHGHDWMTAPAALAAARASGVPLVMHAHALEPDRSGENPDPRVAALESLGLTHADRVVCVSHYTKGVVHRAYGVPLQRMRVVHNAVKQKERIRDWRSERRIEGPLILFLGRVTMQKGPEYFLDAAARVVRLRPDATFVLSGSGDMLPGMIEYSARLGLSRHVHFTGFLRGESVERMYATADLYVMPSVSEPFGITPLEAMALDTPVILSHQSGVSEVVTHALKVDFWDTRELANKMLAVLEYGDLRKSLVQDGREEVRQMRWEKRGKVLREVYEEVCA